MLVDGQWRDVPVTQGSASGEDGGRFVRRPSHYRRQVTRDGSSGFAAEAGRYHLYVSLACPWAHRTLIVRKLKKLEQVVSVSVVDWLMRDDGWVFSERPGATPDTVNGTRFLREVYLLADPRYTGKVTVPVFWDRQQKTIVNNESADIAKFLDSELDEFGDPSVRFYPEELRGAIDQMIAANYDTINNGVYRAGFARTQEAYEEAVRELFARLDEVERILDRNRYLLGRRITLADWFLFTTLVRFDAVYASHFKCNLRRIVDYPNLWGYLRELYQVPGVAETCNFQHIKGHYYQSHTSINPTGIVPIGPELDLSSRHGRG